MLAGNVEIELDGRRVLIDQSAQEVQLLDDSGRIYSRQRIQVAAGSVQGIFSALQGVSEVTNIGAPSRNA